MRYVIGVCIVTGMLIWDGAYREGRYLDEVLRLAAGIFGFVVHLFI